MSKSNVVYTIMGNELEQLSALQTQLIALENKFFGIIEFIGRRQNLDLTKVKFDPNKLVFVEEEKE